MDVLKWLDNNKEGLVLGGVAGLLVSLLFIMRGVFTFQAIGLIDALFPTYSPIMLSKIKMVIVFMLAGAALGAVIDRITKWEKYESIGIAVAIALLISLLVNPKTFILLIFSYRIIVLTIGVLVALFLYKHFKEKR